MEKQRSMRGWNVDDSCTVAAKTVAEALEWYTVYVECDMEDCNPLDEIEEANDNTKVLCEAGNPEYTTIGEILDDLDANGIIEPQIICALDW